jgi:hypothetical protein
VFILEYGFQVRANSGFVVNDEADSFGHQFLFCPRDF